MLRKSELRATNFLILLGFPKIISEMRPIIRKLKGLLYPHLCGISPVQMSNVIQEFSSFDISFEDWNKDIGAGDFWEVVTICSLAKLLEPKVVVEIGTGMGRTTHHLAKNSPSNCRIYTFDINEHPDTGSLYKNKEDSKKIRQVFSNSQTYDFEELFGTVDIVFVDGAHDEESVRVDTVNAFKLVSDGGVILWDDISVDWPGVARGILQHQKGNQVRRIIGTSFGIYRNRS